MIRQALSSIGILGGLWLTAAAEWPFDILGWPKC